MALKPYSDSYRILTVLQHSCRKPRVAMAERTHPTNQDVARLLDRIADLLETRNADAFRILAYRKAAGTVRGETKPLSEIVEREGQMGLEAMPNIGRGIAGLIHEYVRTGRSGRLDRLQAEISPEEILSNVPGVTKSLAKRIHRELNIATLEELEQAAYDGRLEEMRSLTPKKVRDLRIALSGLLSGTAHVQTKERIRDRPTPEPPVSLILEVDQDYRDKARKGNLREISPKRFNPGNEAWLPVLKTSRGGWHFTALYSNTKLAHELGKTHDWVVIYFERNGREGQRTVVTDSQGELRGKRVIRGKELETRKFYETH